MTRLATPQKQPKLHDSKPRNFKEDRRGTYCNQIDDLSRQRMQFFQLEEIQRECGCSVASGMCHCGFFEMCRMVQLEPWQRQME
jgi:hypothetical protein